MAIDSKAKRSSVLGLVVPDGSIDQLDRQTVLGIYGGILATENIVGNWLRATVTFTHPYDASIKSYYAWKHETAAHDVYLSAESGGALGYGDASTGSVVASIYHDTGATPGSTTLKFQGEYTGVFATAGNLYETYAAVKYPAVTKLSSSRVAYVGKDEEKLETYTFDGTNFAQVGNSYSTGSYTYVGLAALSSSRVVFRYNAGIQALDFDGSDWSTVGNANESLGGSARGICALSSTRIAITYSGNLKAFDFDGSDWTQVGDTYSLSSISTLSALTKLTPTRIALASQLGVLATFEFDGSSWQLIGEVFSLPTDSGTPAIAAIGGSRITLIDDVGDELRTYEFDGVRWHQVNSAAVSCTNPALCALSPTRIVLAEEGIDGMQAYDSASTWADISTETATSNGVWEELSLDVTTDADTYDGYRVLIDSSQEYYVFRAAAFQDGTANVRGSTLRIPSDASVILSAYKDNSWQYEGNAEETRVTQFTKTLGVQDAGLVYVDPSAHAVTVYLPDVTTAKGLSYRIENRHYGYGLMVGGDCEAAAEPILTGDNGEDNHVTAGTFARSDTVSHNGTYSFKFTDTVGAGALAHFHDSTADLHGLTASQTYTLVAWVYVPTTGGPSALTEVDLVVYDTTNSATLATASPTAYDTWQRLSLTFTIPASCAAIDIYLSLDAAVSADEFCYVDDVQCYQHYDVTVSGPIENVNFVLLSSDGDCAIVVSDGDKYQLSEYRDHGQAVNGFWRRSVDGEMRCWLTCVAGTAPLDTQPSGAGSFTWTFPKAFANDNIILPVSASHGTYDEARVVDIYTTPSVTAVSGYRLRASDDNPANGRVYLEAIGRWR